MVLDHALVAARDEDEMLDPGLPRLVHDVLDERPIDDGQHFLRHGLGGGQEPGAEAGNRENGFADGGHERAFLNIPGYAHAACFVGKFPRDFKESTAQASTLQPSCCSRERQLACAMNAAALLWPEIRPQ